MMGGWGVNGPGFSIPGITEKPDGPKNYESVVTGAQDIAAGWLEGCSELVHRATYYALFAQGYRIPTDPHGDLLRCAKKEFPGV